MTWEVLATLHAATIRRGGRFLVADLLEPHRTMTTSVKNGGQSDEVRHLVNHQSCEGSGHDARFHVITGLGQEAYHDTVCQELGLALGDHGRDGHRRQHELRLDRDRA